jgi:hypothetical protein
MCLSDEEEIHEISPIKVTWPDSGEPNDGGVFNRKETALGANQTGDIFSTPKALGINRQNRPNVLDPSSSDFGHVPSIEHPDGAADPAIWSSRFWSLPVQMIPDVDSQAKCLAIPWAPRRVARCRYQRSAPVTGRNMPLSSTAMVCVNTDFDGSATSGATDQSSTSDRNPGAEVVRPEKVTRTPSSQFTKISPKRTPPALTFRFAPTPVVNEPTTSDSVTPVHQVCQLPMSASMPKT